MSNPSDLVKTGSILAIVFLEGLAILRGINGWMLALALSLLAGMGGYTFGSKKRS